MAPFVAGLRMRGIDAAYPHLGHTLGPVLDDALDRAAAFLLGLTVD